ncbi:hypothetical protein [Methylobacterium soli]|uniref:Uncharacterized protein n=1 Tax=Methylobacterium soli TaxID=553447 RepID=A0A6L3SSK0_9HYPH|nr:hypothetical protein [Methylobacterium soli]KAB1076409.1 hypothetical protein F6X53_23905 [Methylobacterium soli]GJE41388.1 hypothetical protein AEGHOMDF_0554 [Methylobacterium soli]
MRNATIDPDRTDATREGPRAKITPGPRWLRLGLTLALGLAAGATLFPRKAEGRSGRSARADEAGG